MFRVRPTESDRTLRLATTVVLGLSVAALLVTFWVMIDFLDEQRIVADLMDELPATSRAKAQTLQGELKWQFRLSMLVVLNLIVAGFAILGLSRAYRSSQASLRDIKALAADILSSMDLGVLTTDLQGHVTSINRRCMEMLDANEEWVGQKLSEQNTALAHSPFTSEKRATGEPIDFVIQTSDVKSRKLHAFVEPLKNYRGETAGEIIQLHDITQRILIDEQLRRMERYVGLSSLSVGLHHEIKNPLAALSLHVQLLGEQIEDTSDDTRQTLSIITSEVKRVGQVLESFRDFAAMEQLNLGRLDLMDLVRSQIELIRPRAIASSVDLRVVNNRVREIDGDRMRLEQVLHNLLVNAIDAMPGGGTLTIETREQHDTAILSLEDTGDGIALDLRDKVLDPYFTTKPGGTGLGLAICDKIMRQHEGRLDFRSSSRGTTFTLTLPLHPNLRLAETELSSR